MVCFAVALVAATASGGYARVESGSLALYCQMGNEASFRDALQFSRFERAQAILHWMRDLKSLPGTARREMGAEEMVRQAEDYAHEVTVLGADVAELRAAPESWRLPGKSAARRLEEAVRPWAEDPEAALDAFWTNPSSPVVRLAAHFEAPQPLGAVLRRPPLALTLEDGYAPRRAEECLIRPPGALPPEPARGSLGAVPVEVALHAPTASALLSAVSRVSLPATLGLGSSAYRRSSVLEPPRLGASPGGLAVDPVMRLMGIAPPLPSAYSWLGSGAVRPSATLVLPSARASLPVLSLEPGFDVVAPRPTLRLEGMESRDRLQGVSLPLGSLGPVRLVGGDLPLPLPSTRLFPAFRSTAIGSGSLEYHPTRGLGLVVRLDALTPPLGGEPFATGAGGADLRTQGAGVNVDYRLTDRLHLQGGYIYQQAQGLYSPSLATASSRALSRFDERAYPYVGIDYRVGRDAQWNVNLRLQNPFDSGQGSVSGSSAGLVEPSVTTEVRFRF